MPGNHQSRSRRAGEGDSNGVPSSHGSGGRWATSRADPQEGHSSRRGRPSATVTDAVTAEPGDSRGTAPLMDINSRMRSSESASYVQPPSYAESPPETAARAPAFMVPATRVVQESGREYPAYLHTDDWPFSSDQHDVQREKTLGRNDAIADEVNMPLLTPNSFKQINLPADSVFASTLQQWDIECATKHLGAIEHSVASHDDLHDYTLMQDERVMDVLDLAGVGNAPGLFNDIAQRCRMVFTNQNRLIFTQTNHSAEIGVPKMRCFFAFIPCFHERWSKRKWSSFYSSINASDILKVFVQQTLATSYHAAHCQCVDICDLLWCTVGGTMYSEKDLDGASQTLADHDPDSCMKRWDKTRFMRHALVIRYIDCASNAVCETVAMAQAGTPAALLYQMARSIEANITIKPAEYLKCKNVPRPLNSTPFHNDVQITPLYKRGSYRALMAIALLVSFITFAINPGAAVFMLLAVGAAGGGSFYDGKKARSYSGSITPSASLCSGGLVASQGVGGAVYLLSFISALALS